MTLQTAKYSNFFETTADGNIGGSDESITLSAAPTTNGTNPIQGPFYLVIDPDTPAKREVVLVNSISGVICDVTNGRDRKDRHDPDPSHADGVTIRMAVVGEMFEDLHDRVNDIALTGDVTGTISSSTQDISTSIGSGVIVDADVNASAAIAQSKLNLAVTTSEVAADTLVTESEGITSNDNDTTIPTSAAVKDYVDNNSSDVHPFLVMGA